MKITIEEKGGDPKDRRKYVPISKEQYAEMTTLDDLGRFVIYVPNACGGETRVIIEEDHIKHYDIGVWEMIANSVIDEQETKLVKDFLEKLER